MAGVPMFAHEKPIIKCSHCGGSLGEGWESNCNNGTIRMTISSCSLNYLWGDDHGKIGFGFDHPAMTDKRNDYQNIEFNWNSQGNYRICRKCQCELLGVIGNFFKADLCYKKEE